MKNKLNKGEGRILILIKNGNVAIRREIGILNSRDMAQLILNLELLVDEFKSHYKIGLKKIE